MSPTLGNSRGAEKTAAAPSAQLSGPIRQVVRDLHLWAPNKSPQAHWAFSRGWPCCVRDPWPWPSSQKPVSEGTVTDTAHNHHSSSLLLGKSVSLLMTKEEPWGLGRVLCQEQIPEPTCLTLCSAFMCHRVTEAPGGKSISHKAGNGMGITTVCRGQRIRRAPEQHPTPTPVSFTLHLCCLPPPDHPDRTEDRVRPGVQSREPRRGCC